MAKKKPAKRTLEDFFKRTEKSPKDKDVYNLAAEIIAIMANIEIDLAKAVGGNENASQRARTQSVILTKIMKKFRAISVQRQNIKEEAARIRNLKEREKDAKHKI